MPAKGKHGIAWLPGVAPSVRVTRNVWHLERASFVYVGCPVIFLLVRPLELLSRFLF